MARTTKLNKVFKVATVSPVNIRPLNDARFIALLAATLAFLGLALLAPNPLVESTVAYILALPSIVLLVLYLLGLNLGPLFRPLAALFKSPFLVSHPLYCRGKFGMTQIW